MGKLGQALAAGLRGHVKIGVANRGVPALKAAVALGRGIRAFSTFGELARASKVIIVAVKREALLGVLDAVAADLRKGSAVVSVAAGLPMAALEAHAPRHVGLVRAMPNVASAVGAGVTGLMMGRGGERCGRAVEKIFRVLGDVVWCKTDDEVDAVTAVSGSGVAFALVWLEALADAGVRQGLLRKQALELAAGTFRGAAALVAGGREHPAVARDRVASPGGTTIAGLTAMEAAGVRGAIAAAVDAAGARARELSSQVKELEAKGGQR